MARSISASSDSFVLSLTPSGDYVLFASFANNLVASEHSSGFVDLYLWCCTNGAVSLVSLSNQGGSGGNCNSCYGNVTPDGRYVVFQSDANDLAANDLNHAADVFVRDIAAGTTALVSVNRQGTGTGNGESSNPVITPDGRYVAFVSAASDLVAGDANGVDDVLLFDRLTGQTMLLSQQVDGVSAASGKSLAHTLTPDGNTAIFNSIAPDLVAGDSNGTVDVFAVSIDRTTPSHEVPVITLAGALRQGALITINWAAAPGWSYRVEYKDSLEEPSWHDLPGVVMIAGATASFADQSAASLQRRFYRVRLAE